MKKRHLMRTLVCLLSLLMLLSSALPVMAEDAPPLQEPTTAEQPKEEEDPNAPPSMQEVGAALLYHLERGTAVAEKEADSVIGAGSTVKIMAGLLLCEELESQRARQIEITERMMSEVPDSPGFSLKIKAGDSFTVEQLLYAAVCGSYNDAYYLLAAYAFGSTNALLQKMNRRAAELETVETVYRDITGIQSGSQTCASDLVKIASEAYENDLYMDLCDTDIYSLSSSSITRTIYNRNALISTQGGTVTKYYDKNCYGMSAGSTPADGNCVVTLAKHKGETYICVTLGGMEDDTHEYGYVVLKRLLSWAFDTFAFVEVISPTEDLWMIPVTVSDLVTEIPLRTHESYSAYVPKGIDVKKEITYSIRLEVESLEAPVEKDTFVGYVAIVYQGQTLKTLPIYTTENAERSTFIGVMKTMQGILKNRAALAGILFFVLSLGAWIVTEILISHRRHHKWDRYFSDKVELPKTGRRQMNGEKPRNKK